MSNARALAGRLSVLILALAVASGCGDAGLDGGGGDGGLVDSGDTGSGDAGESSDPESLACPGGAALVPGLNTLEIDGVTRQFFADFPAGDAPAAGALFSWHGFGQSAAAFRDQLALDPMADPDAPLVIITPEDTGLLPPAGLDWAIDGTDGGNVDIALFEAVVGCLLDHHGVDPARIYSFGFSAGSVMTNLLQSRHPELLSATVSESGAWFNDADQAAMVNLPPLPWSWPVLDPADGGVVLLTHGGPNDVTVLNIMNLENAAQAAIPFLAEHGRIVVDCAHEGGHVLAPEVTGQLMAAYFAAHRAGEPSPLASDGGPGFPDSCTVRLP